MVRRAAKTAPFKPPAIKKPRAAAVPKPKPKPRAKRQKTPTDDEVMGGGFAAPFLWVNQFFEEILTNTLTQTHSGFQFYLLVPIYALSMMTALSTILTWMTFHKSPQDHG